VEQVTGDFWTLLVTVLREQGVAVLLILWLLWFVTTKVWKLVADKIVPAWLERQAQNIEATATLLEAAQGIEQTFDRLVTLLEKVELPPGPYRPPDGP